MGFSHHSLISTEQRESKHFGGFDRLLSLGHQFIKVKTRGHFVTCADCFTCTKSTWLCSTGYPLVWEVRLCDSQMTCLRTVLNHNLKVADHIGLVIGFTLLEQSHNTCGTQDVTVMSLLCQNDVTRLYWCNDDIITSCVPWVDLDLTASGQYQLYFGVLWLFSSDNAPVKIRVLDLDGKIPEW